MALGVSDREGGVLLIYSLRRKLLTLCGGSDALG